MSHPSFREKGYSLVELLVVLAIVAILAIASVTMIGDRPGAAVREVADELEGVLTAAQTRSNLTLGDVTLFTDGTWTGTGNNALRLSYQDAAGMTSEAFRSHFSEFKRDHMHAGVDWQGNGWYTSALGAAPALNSIAPGNVEPFLTALANPMFKGSPKTDISVNGNSKRFTTGFFIAVVGLRDGKAIVGGPVAVLVVPMNGTGVYKFYKGSNELTWRRI